MTDTPTDINPVVEAAEVLAESRQALADGDTERAAVLANIGLGYSNLATPQAAKSLQIDARQRRMKGT